MILDTQTVKKIAELSRLELTPSEIEQAQTDLQKILKAFEDLSKIPFPTELNDDARSGLLIKQAQNYSELNTRLVPDEPNNSLSTQTFLSQTPEREGVFVRVPAILNSTT